MAEVARNYSSLPFGYDETFVNEVDEDFLCPICQLPAKEPIQTSCGHRFCEECIKEYLQRYELNADRLLIITLVDVELFCAWSYFALVASFSNMRLQATVS